MRQVLFELPFIHVKIFGYGLMLVAAFWAATALMVARARRRGLDPDQAYDVSLWMILCGLLGARLFWFVQYWGVRVHSLFDFVKVWEGGIVLYGSAFGAAAGFLIYWWRRPFPVWPMLDALAPAIALGIAIGRVGCFLNGCCYGDLCDLPWAVRFPPGSAPWWDQVHEGLLAIPLAVQEQLRHGVVPAGVPWSLPIHPTQLYSTIDGLVLMLLVLAYDPVRRRDGQVMGLFLMAYPVTRFLIEYLRNDERAVLAGLTISQTISVVVFFVGLGLWLYASRQPSAAADSSSPAPAQRPRTAEVKALADDSGSGR